MIGSKFHTCPIHRHNEIVMRFLVRHNRHHKVSQSVPHFMFRKTVTTFLRIKVGGHFVMSFVKCYESHYVGVLDNPPKFLRHFFNQSEVKPKPIVACACTFSRALCRLRVITWSFDWFTGLSPSFLIGQSNYFGFGFTTLD